MKLDWFFEMYLRQPKLPKLIVSILTLETATNPNVTTLKWETPNNMPFNMPIDVVVNGKTQRVEMKDGQASISGAVTAVDPDGWVLKVQ